MEKEFDITLEPIERLTRECERQKFTIKQIKSENEPFKMEIEQR